MKTKNEYSILGLMSGTSLDGIDCALCSFINAESWKFVIKKTKTIPYSNFWKKRLRLLHLKDISTIKDINLKYGQYLGKIINSFLNKETIDFIASHGHTIFHQPENNYTLQIGDGQIIANLTKNTTICDFRSLDVSLGGQGAPLVPIGDLYLFPAYKYCLNLGGFANISIKNRNDITAFDICPVNIVLNQLSKILGFDFDKNGDLAKSGQLNQSLLAKLNQLEFYSKSAPKSLGREWIEKNISPLMINNISTKDIMHTFCEHISIQIGKYLQDGKVLISGGGTYNNYLINRINYYSKSTIIIPKKEIIDYKESLIFAFLGLLKMRNEVNCLQAVTGARKNSSSGKIFFPQLRCKKIYK